jgi:hypothetical protein
MELVGGVWFVKMVGGNSGWCMVCIRNGVENRLIVVWDKSKWAIGTMKFNETWWTWGHGTFCAHEEGGLLGTQLQITLLQNMSPFHSTFHPSSTKKKSIPR